MRNVCYSQKNLTPKKMVTSTSIILSASEELLAEIKQGLAIVSDFETLTVDTENEILVKLFYKMEITYVMY